MTTHNTQQYYKEKNQQIVDEITLTKNLAKNTTLLYIQTLSQYSTYHQQTMQQLLDEADNEEENGIRMKKRKIKNRLLTYKQHLTQQQKQPTTINTRLSVIQATYKFYEIETPHIPQVQNTTHEVIEDIPTKQHIRTALETTNNLGLQAIILFMSSSGTSRNEALSITIQDFIQATKQYHHETTIENVINTLQQQNNVIPTFQLYRQKTHYPYITFCSPEATQKILTYLQHRINHEFYKAGMVPTSVFTTNLDDKLFHFSHGALNKHFSRLNDKLGWGWKGTRRFFHPHALRKFFATELLKSDLDSMTIDFLSGRRISKTHEAYFKADPQKLKQKYMMFMNNLMINEEVVYNEITNKQLEELEHYRKKEKRRDKKIMELEQMLQRYIDLTSD